MSQAAQRRISHVKLGKDVRVRQSALHAFIEAGRVHAPPAGLITACTMTKAATANTR